MSAGKKPRPYTSNKRYTSVTFETDDYVSRVGELCRDLGYTHLPAHRQVEALISTLIDAHICVPYIRIDSISPCPFYETASFLGLPVNHKDVRHIVHKMQKTIRLDIEDRLETYDIESLYDLRYTGAERVLLTGATKVWP